MKKRELIDKLIKKLQGKYGHDSASYFQIQKRVKDLLKDKASILIQVSISQFSNLFNRIYMKLKRLSRLSSADFKEIVLDTNSLN